MNYLMGFEKYWEVQYFLLYSAWWSLNGNICYFLLEQFELIARYKDNQVKAVTLQHLYHSEGGGGGERPQKVLVLISSLI